MYASIQILSVQESTNEYVDYNYTWVRDVVIYIEWNNLIFEMEAKYAHHIPWPYNHIF